MPTQASPRQVVVFDQATKLGYCVVWVHLDKHGSVEEAYRAGRASLSSLTGRLNALHPPLPNGRVRSFACRGAFPKYYVHSKSNERYVNKLPPNC